MSRKYRVVLCLFILVLSSSSVFASWSFAYDSWEGHPRIGSSLVPTGIRSGAISDLKPIFSGWETDLVLLAKAGFHERVLWQHPVNGSLLSSSPLIFDLLQFDWTIGIKQSLAHDQQLFLGYRGSYEKALDSMVEGDVLDSGTVLGIDPWFSSYGGNTLYGLLSGIGTSVLLSYSYNHEEELLDGLAFESSLFIGPKLLNTNASYLAFTAEGAVALMIYQELDEKQHNLYSIILRDNLQFTYTLGSHIPVSFLQETSLGSLVRGYGSGQYPLDGALANRFSLCFNGPEPFTKGFYPRLILFFDVGYGFGQLVNTSVSSSAFLASAGVSVTYSLLSYMDIGYQMAYLIEGSNPMHPGKTMVGELIAHIRF
nr:hypothetical protein [uncultured Sphaerochaeta sp.]